MEAPDIGGGHHQADQNQAQMPKPREELREKIDEQDIHDQVKTHHDGGTFDPFFSLVHGGITFRWKSGIQPYRFPMHGGVRTRTHAHPSIIKTLRENESGNVQQAPTGRGIS